jgi:hypothetical protein
MRRALPFLIAVGLLSSVPGCGDPNAGALFADIQYATRCEMTLGCPGPVNRDVCGINNGDPCEGGAPEARVSCVVQESADGARTLDFSASQGSDFTLTVSQATFSAAGGSAAGARCEVRVTEGANRYEGACGSSPPSAAQPCQISAVRFYDDMGNPTVEGAIFCEFLPNQSQPMLQIEVTQVGSGPGPAAMPGRFRIANCQGLTI